MEIKLVKRPGKGGINEVAVCPFCGKALAAVSLSMMCATTRREYVNDDINWIPESEVRVDIEFDEEMIPICHICNKVMRHIGKPMCVCRRYNRLFECGLVTWVPKSEAPEDLCAGVDRSSGDFDSSFMGGEPEGDQLGDKVKISHD